MPAKADDPLRKVTVNLYEEDVVAAEKYYGHGWSQELRTVWHEHIQRTRRPRTLIDLLND